MQYYLPSTAIAARGDGGDDGNASKREGRTPASRPRKGGGDDVATPQKSAMTSEQLAELDALAARLEDARPQTRQDAIDALGRAAEQNPGGGRQIVALVTARLGHPDWFVRAAAGKALSKVAHQGDQYAVALVAGHLENEDWRAREASLTALLQVARRGDRVAIDAAVGRLEDSQLKVRQLAVRAVGELTFRGDMVTARKLEVLLDHESAGVREQALRCLGQVARMGDEEAIFFVVSCIEDPSWDVQQAVSSVLPQIAEKGNRCAITQLEPLIGSNVKKVSRSAVMAFQKIGTAAQLHEITCGCSQMLIAERDNSFNSFK